MKMISRAIETGRKSQFGTPTEQYDTLVAWLVDMARRGNFTMLITEKGRYVGCVVIPRSAARMWPLLNHTVAADFAFGPPAGLASQ